MRIRPSTLLLLCFGLIPCQLTSAQTRADLTACEAETSQAPSDPFGLLAEFPKTERLKLSDGSVVLLPAHLHDYSSTVLLGAAPIENVRKVLAAEDLEPLPVEGHPELAKVNVVALFYRRNDFGSYNETMIMIPSRERVIECGGPTRTGVFVHHIGVNSKQAVLPGLDIWGYSKVLERSSITSDDGDVSVQIDNCFAMSCADCAEMPLQAMPRQDILGVSSYERGRRWLRIVTEGDAAIRPFDPANDVFALRPGSPIANKLLRLAFVPSVWVYAPYSVGVSLHHP